MNIKKKAVLSSTSLAQSQQHVNMFCCCPHEGSALLWRVFFSFSWMLKDMKNWKLSRDSWKKSRGFGHWSSIKDRVTSVKVTETGHSHLPMCLSLSRNRASSEMASMDAAEHWSPADTIGNWTHHNTRTHTAKTKKTTKNEANALRIVCKYWARQTDRDRQIAGWVSDIYLWNSPS